jgi:molybdate transport system substrate-binding protein
MHRLLTLAIASLLPLGLLVACSNDGERVRVLAASSLTDVLPRLVEDFERRQPDVTVTVAYGGSQALATQIEEGAPADVFVSANAEQAERLASEGLAVELRSLARNELVIAVASDSELESIEDLAGEGVTVALGVASVPVGALTAEVLAGLPEALRAAVEANVITEDPNVRAVLSRVDTGEADAGFVYRTDLDAASGLRAIPLDGAPANTYVALAVDTGAGPSTGAEAFLDYLASPAAAAILRGAGFEPIEGVR